MKIDNYTLDGGGACPEEYDVYDSDDNLVGYMRLRHGYFYCTSIDGDNSGKIVYQTTSCQGDGIFEDFERESYLHKAVELLDFYINNLKDVYFNDDILKPCPFCGFKPDRNDDDCVYPAVRDKSIYQVVCYETGGGCSATVLGSTPTDAIRNWNKRVK